MGVYLGIDIGGTKTALALYDRHFQTAAETAMPTRPERGCRDLVCRIAEAANGMLRRLDPADRSLLAAGVACPGPLDLKRGRIVYIPTMGFCDEPLTAMLEDALELPVALENDTNAAALCESCLLYTSTLPPRSATILETPLSCPGLSDSSMIMSADRPDLSRPRLITRERMVTSMLPLESRQTTFLPSTGILSNSTAATDTAPAPSAISFCCSIRVRIAVEISSSVTVTISSTYFRQSSKVRSPGVFTRCV